MSIEFKIDYLSFTVPFYCKSIILDFLGVEVVWLDRGFRGYKEAGMLVGGGIVAYSIGRDDMHFDLPGKACDYHLKTFLRYKELILLIFRLKGKISRCDLAVDVKEELSFDKVLATLKAGGIVSRARKMTLIEDFACKGGRLGDSGKTLYLGSRKSWKLLRIYDKAKQVGGELEWVRFELLLRDEMSTQACEKLAMLSDSGEGVGVLFLGFLSGFVDFRKKNRKDRVSWWCKLVGLIEKVKLSLSVVKKSIEDLVGWIERQVSPSLATVREYYKDGFNGLLEYMLIRGTARMGLKHRMLLLETA